MFRMSTAVAAILAVGLLGLACSRSGLKRSADGGTESGGQAGTKISSETAGGLGGSAGIVGASGGALGGSGGEGDAGVPDAPGSQPDVSMGGSGGGAGGTPGVGGAGGGTAGGTTGAGGGMAGTGGTGNSCGGVSCGAYGDFCDIAAGLCSAGAADVYGRCVLVGGGFCAPGPPVCGCDGQTYSNDCVRQEFRVYKKFDGACTTADAGAGGTTSTGGTTGAGGASSSGGATSSGGSSAAGGSGGKTGADGGTTGCATDCSATSCGTGFRPVCDTTVQHCLCSLDCTANPGTCGMRESCQSVCSPDGTCVCRGSCGTEGQIGFFKGCCPGLVEIFYYQDTTSCTNPPGAGLVVCTTCGDKICGLGENRCNCPQDCP